MICRGRFQGPSYLTKPAPEPGSKLSDGGVAGNGSFGTPSYQRDAPVQFVVLVPCELQQQQRPASQLVQYGHGLLWSRGEVRSKFLGKLANDNGWVFVLTDWVGMSSADGLSVFRLFVSNLDEFSYVPGRLIQSFVNFAVTLRLTHGGTIAQLPDLAVGGTPLITASTPIGFYGYSQGSILGGAYMAVTPGTLCGNVCASACPCMPSCVASCDAFSTLHVHCRHYTGCAGCCWHKFRADSQPIGRLYVVLLHLSAAAVL